MMHPDLVEAWRQGAVHYAKLAAARTSEDDAPERLALLVLADYCTHHWSSNRGGPSLEMVLVAEGIVGHRLDAMVAHLLTVIQNEKPLAAGGIAPAASDMAVRK